MEELQTIATQPEQVLPQVIQVYHPAASNASVLPNQHIIHISQATQDNINYQPITSQAITIPVNCQVTDIVSPSSQDISHSILQEITIQNHRTLETLTRVLPNQELHQAMPITQQVILPTVYEQHIVLEVPNQCYNQFHTPPQHSCNAENVSQDTETMKSENGKSFNNGNVEEMKLEPEISLVVENKRVNLKAEAEKREAIPKSIELSVKKKRVRSLTPNPMEWACNIRKQKHQRGEAYISRRGKLVPERKIKNTKDCMQSCKFKCSTLISDTDREHLFKAFYSLNSNEKKDFLLNTTERTTVKHSKKMHCESKRRFSFKYFFLLGAERYTVCKNFYLGTLSISQKPVYNVHLGKSEMNIPKPDGRGLSQASTHSLPTEIKDRVRKHIMSYKTADSEPIKQFCLKKQYIVGAISVKQMYQMYSEQCQRDGLEVVKESMYRKILKREFNLNFKKIKSETLCSKCKEPVKKK